MIPFLLKWSFEVLFKVYLLVLQIYNVVDWDVEGQQKGDVPSSEYRQYVYIG
jgi:hypothetical protein